MTAVLEPALVDTLGAVPATSMTSVAVEGGSPAAVSALLELLARRVLAIGDVEIHDVVVNPATSVTGYSTATVYFVA